MPELIYGKWGTHVERGEDEPGSSLMDFVHDGARLTMQGRGLEQLPGCAERIERPAQGEWGDLVLYLWPYVRITESAPKVSGPCCEFHAEVEDIQCCHDCPDDGGDNR